MKDNKISAGDVVQINPDHDLHFGGCFMVVTEVRNWGLIGYVKPPGTSGLAYYRVPFINRTVVPPSFTYIGRADWRTDP